MTPALLPTDGDILDLGGRSALVTGAGDVGREIGVTLARHGAGLVVVTDIVEDQLAVTAEAIRREGVEALPVRVDLTDWASVSAAAETVGAVSDRPVQILVNNAGLPANYFDDSASHIGQFRDTTPESWERMIRLNLYGVMYVTRAFINPMLDSGWGRVVTVVSDAGRTGERNQAAYSAAKAGAAGFMRTLAIEVGPHGVTANCISLATLWRPPDGAPPSDEFLQRIRRRYPAGRPGYPQDLAGLVLFLVSNAGEWITGQVYPLNGGYSFAL